MRHFTRRAFVELTARHTIAARLAAAGLLSYSCIPPEEQGSALNLDENAVETLIAIVDEIIPASNGMPAASEVGALNYFALLAAEQRSLPETLQRGVAAVDDLSQERFENSFSSLSKERRILILSELESRVAPEVFANLRNYVYEAYYLQPRVWALLGYEPYPTNAPGPEMEPFDEALLNRVRSMPKGYKEV